MTPGAKLRRALKRCVPCSGGQAANRTTPDRLYETEVLEKTICRIAGLLQVGFGDAGAQIIAQNLKVRSGRNSVSSLKIIHNIPNYLVLFCC